MEQLNLFTMQKELTQELNEASRTYYSEDKEIMSDKEYDSKYDQLQGLEKQSGIVLPDSPTKRVGYEVVSKLKKVKHEFPALSLDKTKDRNALKEWLGHQEGCLSWKCDGLTIVLTYIDGRLQQAVTRGNGEIGEDVTHNAVHIKGIPREIPFIGKLIVRGETLTSYADFNRINELIENPDDKYKNPRNLTAGSLRQLDSQKASERSMMFKAFDLVYAEGKIYKTYQDAFDFLMALGLSVVDHTIVTSDTILNTIDRYEAAIPQLEFPTDGLVLSYNDITYGKSLGMTGKFPKGSIAFKWKDATEMTTLRFIEWSASKTGLLNPVAVFDPVELEGTTVTRASIHNISYLKEKDLQIGDSITVYKANMIIPQIDENLSADIDRSHEYSIPTLCPVCGSKTVMISSNDTESLKCPNPDCVAKHIGKFVRLSERDALNITDFSEATARDFISRGWLSKLQDIFSLSSYKDEIIALDGYGEKSYQNLIDSIERCRNTTFRQYFYSLGIPGIGHNMAKILEKYFAKDNTRTKTQQLLNLMEDEHVFNILQSLDGIGEGLANDFVAWWKGNSIEAQELLKHLNIVDDVIVSMVNQDLANKIFVITGALDTYKNRDELKNEIESRGGKVSGSVSSKTSYLINNDLLSTTGKNKKAKELGIPIISELQYKEL